jgi:hypothetical protein
LMRPAARDECADPCLRQFGKLRDAVCCRATRIEPKEEYVCDPCCEPAKPDANADEPCGHAQGPPIFLASITFTPDGKTQPKLDNQRRVLLGHHATKVDGINWVHGGFYQPEQADRLLHHGLRIHFSRGVRPETIQPGIMDVLLYMGGGNVCGDVKHLTAKIKPYKEKNKVHGVICEFGSLKRERLDPGDRIHIILRSAFILDECCRPLDGLHVGGWVPFRADPGPPIDHPPDRTPIPKDCEQRIGTFAAWASGTGFPGGNFESWFYVSDIKEGKAK